MSHFLKSARDAEDCIDMIYENGCTPANQEDLMRYHNRHGTPSILILTQTSPEVAAETARLLKPRIEDKFVIEIGAGVGFLALEMAKYARKVVAFEIDPGWSWVFTRYLYHHKPPNLSWIFGNAKDFIGSISADIAIVVSHSGQSEMVEIGKQLATEVCDLFDSELKPKE